MNDREKTKRQLVVELAELRQRAEAELALAHQRLVPNRDPDRLHEHAGKQSALKPESLD